MTARELDALRELIRAEVTRALRDAQPSTVPDAITVDEAAAMLGVCRDVVYDAAGRQELPHRRLGKRLIFSRLALGDCLRTGR